LHQKQKNKSSKKSFLGKQEFKQPVIQFYIEIRERTQVPGDLMIKQE